MSNTDFTLKSGGKLGSQCQDLSKLVRLYCADLVGLKTFSYAFWYKPETSSSTVNWNDVIAFYDSSGSKFRLETSYSNNYILSIHNNSGYGIIQDKSSSYGSNLLISSATYSRNTWYHVAVTVEENKDVRAYINGELKYVNDRADGSITGYFNLGESDGNDKEEGSMNDLRIYDHALSPMEVNRISQGLVLHYPLNNNGFGNENLVLNSNTFATGSGASGITPSTTSDGLHQVIATSGNSNWHASWATSTATSLLENAFAEGDPFTISFTIKSENANKTNPPDIYVKSGMGYYSMQGSVTSNWSTIYYSGTWKDANSISFHLGFSGRVGTYLFKNWKVEKGSKVTPWCPNSSDDLATTMGMNDGIEYDCSGFENNGTRVGEFSCSTDTPRYMTSLFFNGTDSCIRVPFNATAWQTNFTINLWFKKEELGSKNYETLFGGGGGFEMDTRPGASTVLSLYMASTRGGNVYSSFNFGEWYMVTLVNDGTNELYYVNGELQKTIEKKAMPNSNYWIGAWASDTGQNYKGLISDFRVYATALSDDDVLALYNLGGSLDSNGTFHTYEYVEV